MTAHSPLSEVKRLILVENGHLFAVFTPPPVSFETLEMDVSMTYVTKFDVKIYRVSWQLEGITARSCVQYQRVMPLIGTSYIYSVYQKNSTATINIT